MCMYLGELHLDAKSCGLLKESRVCRVLTQLHRKHLLSVKCAISMSVGHTKWL